ncbi:surfeit locus protein, partial [Rhizophlyctis rosea]
MATEVALPSLDGLSDRLALHQSVFDSLVELIPPKYYLTTENDHEPAGKYAHNKKNKAPKQAIKEATKKAKKAKLDPENYKSVLDIQAEADKASKEAAVQEDEEEEASDDDDAEEVDEMEVDDDEDDEPSSTTPNVKPLPTGSILELRAKIQNRIKELAAKRGGPSSANGTEKGGETPPRSRQEILEKRAKRKAEKRVANLKKKEKKKGDTTGMATPTPKTERSDEKEVVDSVSFGKLDFGIPESASKKRKADLAGQLKQVEAKKAKLETLSQTNPLKAAQITESQQWSKLSHLAEGEKVKDDVKLLKKSLKRKEKEKAKSSAVWNDRQNTVKKDQEQRQKKREENLK